jgi:PAS domain S-box-containing protein
MACAAYIRQYLVKSELASRLGFANNRLRLAMKSGKTVAWDWDIKNGRYSWFGDTQTQFGIPSDTYVGRVEDFHRSVHPEDRERVTKAVKDAMQSRKPYGEEFRILWPHGTVRWISAEGEFHYAANGEAKRMLGISVDITDRKRVEEALRESEERLRLAAEAGKMYAYEWDVATDVIVCSPDYMNVLGLAGEPIRLSRRQLLDKVHPDDRPKFIAAVADLTPENPTCRVNYRMPLPSGAVIWLENNARAFFDGQDKMLRIIGMVADVTERRLAEDVLASMSRRVIDAEEYERSRIAEDLHEDIGQRLALLAIKIEQLKTDPLTRNVETQSRLEAVWKQILGVLTDVKASAHELHSPRFEYLGIAAVIRSFCDEFGQRKGVRIDFRSHDLPSFVAPDISLCLFRVLQEALYNGVKHSGVRHFEVQLWSFANEIHLAVSDSGAGFDIEAARNDRLGIVGMRERLKLLNGTFSIESQPQHGTTIHARVLLSSRIDSMRAAGQRSTVVST